MDSKPQLFALLLAIYKLSVHIIKYRAIVEGMSRDTEDSQLLIRNIFL
ncbi:hypothetical protein N482_23810 [Pseudoalteromonas luteoviolacea NCIMB 1942]|uniref:Transposase DDE domain-containing protein n=1 Tax=Pseudoalteromonas luteoviolacea NCIMB 1942 TaxID=1365253 RepID=A0A167GXB6_9GAMM|nr:hypothetical protein N482_23810 [Pseudoalteromonas luteoviolacea NCIMB 1942]